MQIKQLSIFVENKAGRLAEITAVLANANIDIRAISIADTSDFGILRLIVDNPDEAVEALLKNELEYHTDATCDHHGEHHHEGGCGDHDCGGHSCGDH